MKKNKKDTYIQLSLFPDEVEPAAVEKPSCTGDVRRYDHEELFARLSESSFRSSFHLSRKDIEYIDDKGMDTIRRHAADFVARRLAPAYIANDGKQTPMHGHPVFVAQHATACCCRGCFEKWHHVGKGRVLTADEQEYAVSVLTSWIEKEYHRAQSEL